MRLQPVYLLASTPNAGSAAARPGRRALLGGGAALLGASAAGFLFGRGFAAPAPRAQSGDAPSGRAPGDALDGWLLELAAGDAGRLLRAGDTLLYGAARSAASWRMHERGVQRLEGLLRSDLRVLATEERCRLLASLLECRRTVGAGLTPARPTPAELMPAAGEVR